VIAVDNDTRAKPPQDAGIAIAECVKRLLSPATRVLYQKMDSTLRGNWARETACALRAVATMRGRRPLALVAPAFPAVGRTTVGGRSFVNGIALEQTETWGREGTTRSAEPGLWLAAEGLRVAHAALDSVRYGPDALTAIFAAERAAGTDAIVCDAQCEADLDAIARAALTLDPMPLCVGSAGLMRALAGGGKPAASGRVVTAGPVLTVVGSASLVSSGQARVLIEERAVTAVTIAPSALRRGSEASSMRAHAEQIDAALAKGRDLVVAVDGREGVDLRQGSQISAALADLVAPRLVRLGALVATGGETARAILTRAGVAGLRVHGEVATGIPLSTAWGTVAIPVVTKAGAFGQPMTLVRCLDALRGLSRSP